MNINSFPTKGNLIIAKNSLALAKQGYELMDKKRNILIRELMSLISQAESIQSQIDSTFSYAYKALQRANIELGISQVNAFAFAIPIEDSVTLKSRSIMGTEIPLVQYDNTKKNTPDFGLFNTNSALDEAKLQFEKVKDLTIKLSMIENAAYRLAYNIKKTQKRANSLQNITIPNYETLTKNISNALEEKEREEFTRLKVIKSRI
ncbi:V/A-type H+-transporting ATPase subunit D [Lachnospiraceae bacterium RM5]|nr:V/A-type H+-transporting ATPase subunit D [Lachnospiraceae bacterium RM5]